MVPARVFGAGPSTGCKVIFRDVVVVVAVVVVVVVSMKSVARERDKLKNGE